MRTEIYVVTTKLDEHIKGKRKCFGNFWRCGKRGEDCPEETECCYFDVANERRETLEAIKLEIMHEFGGMTEIPNCKGYWEDNGLFFTDNVNLWLIYAYSKNTKETIEAFAKRIKELTWQKSQAFTIDGMMYLV